MTPSGLHIGIFPNQLTAVRGGSELLAMGLASSLLRRGHRITLICNSFYGTATVLPVDPVIRTHFFNLFDGDYRNVHALRACLMADKLDVFVAFNSSKLQLFLTSALMGTGVPYIYSELSAPVFIEQAWNRPGRLAAMSAADAIHLLVPEYASSLPAFLQERVKIIPSCGPGQAALGRLDAPPQSAEPAIVSLGKHDDNKQLGMLVAAFEQVSGNFPQWHLNIWGTGPDEQKLDAMIAGCSVAHRIHRNGNAPNALEALRGGQIYCIPSRTEGMPLTLLEAMTCGLPSVGFVGCPGVNALICHEKSGLLAPEMTVDSLAGQLARLMGDASLRQRLGTAAATMALDYEPEHIFDCWEQLLRDTAQRCGATRMDAFQEEPFASQARLSAAARREYIFRNFGEPMPFSWPYYKEKARQIRKNLRSILTARAKPLSLFPTWAELTAVCDREMKKHTTLINSILSVKPQHLAQAENSTERALPGNQQYLESGYFRAMLRRYFLAGSAFCRNAEVLEIGAGQGWGSRILACYARKVVCVEREPSCRLTSRLFGEPPTVEWHSADIFDFLATLPAASMDVVTGMEFLEHLSPQEAEHLLEECCRVLRPGGMGIFSSSFPTVPPKSAATTGNEHHQHIFSHSEIMTLGRRHFAECAVFNQWIFMARKGQ